MSDVVGSASFELRATRDKIPADLEAARQDILAATKKTEDELSGVVGKGTSEGNKKAAESFAAPKAAASDAGTAIKTSMQSAGAEIAAAVKSGTDKAKADLDSLAAKAREVQPVQKAWVPDDAYRKATNAPYTPIQPLNLPTPNVSAPALKDTSEAAKDVAGALDTVGKNGIAAEAGLGAVTGGSLAAAATVGGLIAGGVLLAKTLYEMGTAAMKSASDMDGTAKRIGVSTDALQEWRFVAQKTGETAGAADSAIDSFGKKLAGAASQLSKEDVKAFRALGFEPEQLKSFNTVEEALDVVTDRIKGLASESDRAGIAEKLGLGALSTAFKDNSTDIADLRDEAHKLGVVMDAEVIRRGAEAQGQFETLSGVIDGQLKSAFVDLAPVILAAIGLVATLATALGNALDAFRDLENKTGRGLATQNQNLRDKVTFAYGQAPKQPGGQLTAVQQGWVRELAASDAEIARRAREGIVRNNPTDRTVPNGTQLVIPPERTPKGRVDRSAERETRRSERVEQEIFRAKQRLLDVADEETMSAQQRYDLAQDRLKMEREARDAEIKSKTTRGELTQTEAQQLASANQKADNLEDSVLLDRSFREIQKEQIAAQQVLLAFVNQRLSLEADGALTEKERRDVEKEILKLRQKERRAALERAVNDPTASPAERSAARKNLGQLDKMESAENSNFDMSSTGARMGFDAIEGVRERARWVEEAADAYAAIDKLREEDRISEEEAAQAKAKINADLNEKRLASTSEFFGNLVTLANSSNATLAAIGKAAGIAQATIDGVVAVQKAWASAPFPFNLPAVAATTVAVAANVATIAGVGFAEGGYTGDGSKYEPAGTVHKGEYVFDAAATQRIGVAKLHALRFGHLPGFAEGGFVGLNLPGMSAPSIPGTGRSSGRAMNFDLRGAVMTSDILAQMEGMAAATHGAAVRDARRAAPRDIARRDRFKLGRNED